MGRSRKRADWRPNGRKPKHGARQLQRALAANELDGRTKVARMLRELRTDLAADLGGWECCSVRQRMLIEEAATQKLIVASVLNYAGSHPNELISNKGELMPVLRHSYLAWSAQLVRTLLAIGLEPKRADGPEDLEQYLRQREAEGAATTPEPAETTQHDGVGNGIDQGENGAGAVAGAAEDHGGGNG